MVNLTIDNKAISVPEGTTIMEAARQVGVTIPKLCYLKDINNIGACRVCVVEIEGQRRLSTSCNTAVQEGMVVHTNSKKVRDDRKMTVNLILSQHNTSCTSCVKSGNCTLQKLSKDLNICDVPFEEKWQKDAWNPISPLVRDSSKCIQCMRCVQVCDKIQSLGVWAAKGTGSRATIAVRDGLDIMDANCSMCGQCITHCPVGALSAKDETQRVWDAISDPKKVTVMQIAPAVRAAWGEELGLSTEQATIGKIIDAARRMGVDYVFDTSFTADLTIMEEGTEFIKRFTSGELTERPMFTSCCPGWIRFIKTQYPQLVPKLSSAKSPQQMFSAMMKTYFAEIKGIDPNDMFTISIMPCSAKKYESNMPLMYGEYAGRGTDVVLTTRELTRMVKASYIDPQSLVDDEPDAIMKDWSGAGVIFGATGGVMEAALRSAYFLITGKNPDADAFSVVRSEEFSATKVATVDINGIKVRAAVVSGLGNARKLLDAIEANTEHFDFVEVMACPGGCVGGGGQPIHDGEERALERGENLYDIDKNMSLRFSHENADVLKAYEDYLGEPNGHKAHALLHTDQSKWDLKIVDWE